MINLRLLIANPWFRKRDGFKPKDYYYKDARLSTNKNLEIQISRLYPTNLIDISLDLRWWGQDHQGPRLDLNLFGFMFNVQIYDSRHWNYDENRWYTDEEAEEEARKWHEEREKEKGA